MPTVQPKNVTLSKKAGKWFISFKYELESTNHPKQREKVGVDIGIKSLATCSDGTVYPNPKAFKRYKKKLRRIQRKLSRQKIGSNNREKTKRKVGKLHKRIADIRRDSLHKLTINLAKNHGEVIIENLNVSGMLKNHRLANAIADCGFYEFKRQLHYKTQWYGSKLTIVDRFYPSSQLCCECNHRQKMPLKLRIFKCENCGVEIDRDLNASNNLERWHPEISFPTTSSSEERNACGELNKPAGQSSRDSMKQEVDIKPVQLTLFDLDKFE